MKEREGKGRGGEEKVNGKIPYLSSSVSLESSENPTQLLKEIK